MSKFKELSKCEIGQNKSVIISQRDDEKYSIAQVAVAPMDGKPINIFLKNAITTDLNGMKGIRDALNEAIAKEEQK